VEKGFDNKIMLWSNLESISIVNITNATCL